MRVKARPDFASAETPSKAQSLTEVELKVLHGYVVIVYRNKAIHVNALEDSKSVAAIFLVRKLSILNAIGVTVAFMVIVCSVF